MHYTDPLAIDNSPIFFAIRMGNAEAVRILTQTKKSLLLAVRNVEGKTPIDYAESLGMQVISSILIEELKKTSE